MGKACGTMKKSKCKKETDRCSWQNGKCVEANGDKDDGDKDDSDKGDGDKDDGDTDGGDKDDDDKANEKACGTMKKSKCKKEADRCSWQKNKCVDAPNGDEDDGDKDDGDMTGT